MSLWAVGRSKPVTASDMRALSGRKCLSLCVSNRRDILVDHLGRSFHLCQVDVLGYVAVDGQFGSLVADAEGRRTLVDLDNSAGRETKGRQPMEARVVLGSDIGDASALPRV